MCPSGCWSITTTSARQGVFRGPSFSFVATYQAQIFRSNSTLDTLLSSSQAAVIFNFAVNQLARQCGTMAHTLHIVTLYSNPLNHYYIQNKLFLNGERAPVQTGSKRDCASPSLLRQIRCFYMFLMLQNPLSQLNNQFGSEDLRMYLLLTLFT